MAFLAIIRWKKLPVSKREISSWNTFDCVLWISYVFLCFFYLLFLLFFYGETICGRHFWSTYNAKTNSFQPLRVKISIFNMNYVKKLNLHWVLVHKLTFWSHFRLNHERAYTKSYLNFRTVPPGVNKFGVKMWLGNLWKKKVIKCRGESFAQLQSKSHSKML